MKWKLFAKKKVINSYSVILMEKSLFGEKCQKLLYIASIYKHTQNNCFQLTKETPFIAPMIEIDIVIFSVLYPFDII